MNKIVLLLALFFVSNSNQSKNIIDKPKIAILKLKSVNAEESLVFSVEKILRTQLIGSPDFDVVERDQINQILQEQKRGRNSHLSRFGSGFVLLRKFTSAVAVGSSSSPLEMRRRYGKL